MYLLNQIYLSRSINSVNKTFFKSFI